MLKYMQGKDPMDSTSTGLTEDVEAPIGTQRRTACKFAIPAPLDWKACSRE